MGRHLPVIYSTPMVQALEKDLKRQTRRVHGLDRINEDPARWVLESRTKLSNGPRRGRLAATFIGPADEQVRAVARYAVGDTMWVRETFCTSREFPGYPHDPFYFKADQPDLADYCEAIATHRKGSPRGGLWVPHDAALWTVAESVRDRTIHKQHSSEEQT